MNRWFEKTQYTPQYTGESPQHTHPTLRPFSGRGYGRRWPPSASRAFTPPPAIQWITIVVSILAGLVQIYAALYAGLKVGELLNLSERTWVVHDGQNKVKPLHAIKLERVAGLHAAESLIASRDSGSNGLLTDWNRIGPARHGGHRHYMHGANAPDDPREYVAIPRPGMEREYRDLQQFGFAGLALHEFHVPQDWKPLYLAAMKHLWASGCGVEADWIDLWSTFKDPDTKHLENNCKAGGVCFVIAAGSCDAETWAVDR